MGKMLRIIKKDTVLVISWVLAVVSAFFVMPDKTYAEYIDWRSLGILWSLMIITQGYMENGVFEKIGHSLLLRTRKVWQLVLALITMCFFGGMVITNDVALITFVPFAIIMLKNCEREDIMIPVVVLQTIAANLGSMMTPIGNPQNLYLYELSGMSIGQFILWMLPFTMIAAALLLVSLLFIRDKGAEISVTADKKVRKDTRKRINIIIFTLLFVVALLVVSRWIPWYILACMTVVIVFVADRRILLKADYGLLLTFVGFFIFTGNIGRIAVVSNFLANVVNGREVIVGILASQCISNVPAALLLSGYTDSIRMLLVGVNIGGLGTLIASMASLISYKLYVNEVPGNKGKYFVTFTFYNLVYLIIMFGCTLLL